MIITKDDWLEYFPFKSSPRVEQIEAINFALNSYLNGKKYVIVSAATGCGKSAIGITISRFLRSTNLFTQNSLLDSTSTTLVERSFGTFILTTQKILQQQYMNDFGGDEPNKLKTIKSSTSYMCQMHKDVDEKLSCGEVHRLMSANAFFKVMYEPCVCKCKYKLDKQIFLNSLEGVTNYSYFFAESKYAKGIQKRELIIADEAHSLQENLGSFVELSISEKFAQQQLNVKMPDDFKDIKAVFSWVKIQYLKALKLKVVEIAKILDNLKDVSSKIKSLQEHATRHDLLDKHLCKINRFIETFDADNWIWNLIPAQGKSQRKIELKPIDVSHFAEDHLFNYADRFLFLSATIFDKSIFCQSLGLKDEEVDFIRLRSPFETKNRIIHIMPIGSMSKKEIENTLPQMCKAIKVLLEEHKQDKGIIHTVNNKITNSIIENINDPRLVTHNCENRELILKLHEECKKPSVLVSPSMTEGVDLSGDKSRFQIICKMPFPYLGDKIIQKRMQLNPRWYSYKTMLSFIQAVGRSVRNQNDYAITYVLDSDWNMFFKISKNMFPEEILESIKR